MNSSEACELISFRVDNQEFCLDIMAVREIRGWTHETPLPHSPAYVRGVINLRGAVLPIVDLKARLGLGESDPSARSVIIVVQVGSRLVGLLVDAVSEIVATSLASVQPTPNVATEVVAQFIRGILAMEGRMVSWISLEQVVPQDEDVGAAA